MLFLDLRTHRPDRDLRMLGNEILVKFKEIIEEIYISQSLTPMSEEEIREYVIKEYPFIENIYGNTEIWDNLIYRQVQSNIKFQSHLLSRVEDKKENLPMEEGDEDKYEKGKFIISDPYIQRIKDKFSGSVDYMSGVNDGLYSMFYGLMGYTEIVKILEKGLQGRGIDVRAYAEKYINDKPESVLVKPFKALLEGNTNPDKLTLLNKPIEDKPVTLGKNSCLLDYTFPGGRFYNEDKGKREETKPSREELIKFCKFVLPTIDQFVKDPYDKLVDQYLNKKDNPVEGKQ
jgi:hypothetical protein